MCGITGIWGCGDTDDLEGMMKLLGHRGPDAEGVFLSPDKHGALGHTRLSIMDPEGGDQPIYNEERSKAVIANGEIYNFPLLRPELALEHSFSTTNDSEAILHLYEDAGENSVDSLDGTYAFIIADGKDIFAARDPLGIKPLYYGKRGDATFFASELKALSGRCDEVKEFPPGTLFHSRNGFRTFYRVPQVAPEERPAEKHIGTLRETLEGAVTKRLMSAVPLGTFLSGGIDSSIITAVTRKHLDELHTFSVGIEGCNDLEAARVVSRHLDTIHHEYIITPEEVVKMLPDIIYHLESFDQDLVRSAIPCYFTSRLASDYVKVILTGEGADELFAGYTYYKDIDDTDTPGGELRRSVSSLHNINLQRVDRMTMAHSIEGRVPFPDLEMIVLGQEIPAGLKLYGDPPVEKWVLRKAFEDMLPDEIISRVKEQFDEGSGTVDLLAEAIEDEIKKHGAASTVDVPEGIHLRSDEERYFFKIFTEVFDGSEVMLENVARWADRPV